MKRTTRLIAAVAQLLSLLQFACAADVPISGLPAASSVTSSNLTIVVDTGEPNPSLRTKKATVNQLVDGLPAASAGTKGTMSAADKIKLDAATASAAPSTLMSRDGSGNTAAHSIALTSGTVSAAPSSPNDITNKAYVDAVSTGLAVHNPAVAATVGSNITLSGGAPSTLDGVTLSASDRILVKNQTDPKENGIYTVSVLGSGANGTWVRAADADTGAELVSGSYIFINGGTTWASSAWVMTTPGAITIGVSDINWTLFNQVTNILASNIIGQIVTAQIADAAMTTAKFASGIQPVSVVSSLPSPSGYTGPRSVFNTSDSKLYRYNGTAFTAATAAADMTGQIVATQISDSAITTPKLAAGAVTANEIAADTITAGQIAAGAINTSELAANAVIASKIAAGTITTTQIAALTILAGNIAAGTITADKMNVTSLSAISANIGTITAGSITGVSITSTVGSIAGFSLSSNKLSATASGVDSEWFNNGSSGFVMSSPGLGSISMNLTAMGIVGTYAHTYNGVNRFILSGNATSGSLNLYNSGGTATIQLAGSSGAISADSVTLAGIAQIGNSIKIGGHIEKISSDGWAPNLYDGGHDVAFQWNGSALKVRIDNSSTFTITTTP